MVRKFIASFFATVLLGATLFSATAPAYAGLFDNAKSQATCGANLSDNNGSGTCTDTTNSESNVSTLLKTVLNILSLVAGVIAVIMIIISGIRFVTSQGDSGSVSSARNTIIYAIVGIVIVVLSQFVVKFVVGKSQTTHTASTTTSVTNPDGSVTTTTTSPDGTVKVCTNGVCRQ